MVDPEIQARVDAFHKHLLPLFHRRKVHSNLTPIQEHLLATLRHNPDFIVLNSDKNLGPVLLEREVYVQRCLTDHLLTKTYQQLSPEDAHVFTTETGRLIAKFLEDHRFAITKMDLTYLQRTLDRVTDPYAYFYALAKIHKTPWKTRPIVSVSGSLLYGLGKWLDQQFQPIIRKLPTYLSSSFELKTDIDKMAGLDFSRLSLFTGDVVAMYPSINLEDAFLRIENFLSNSPLCEHVRAGPLITALKLLMTRNCFRFGDTYWLQTDGTAMGTPPAPSFATLYYGIFELDLLQRFGSSLHYLRRYIDDQLGIWIHHPDAETDRQLWEEFKTCQDNYCSLDWEFSTLSKTANFLDLTLSVESFQISTKLYEKPLNLHLYIPPNSAHTSSVRLGLVTGGIFRILRLTSRDVDTRASLSKFHSYLVARGYKLKFLRSAFQKALHQFGRHKPKQDPSSSDELCFLHLPFHDRDPPRTSIQQAFCTHILRPSSLTKTFGRACNHRLTWKSKYVVTPLPLVVTTQFEPHLWELRNASRARVPIERLIVAYSRPPNLNNLLFPRHVESKCPTARPVSSIQTEILDPSSNTESN